MAPISPAGGSIARAATSHRDQEFQAWAKQTRVVARFLIPSRSHSVRTPTCAAHGDCSMLQARLPSGRKEFSPAPGYRSSGSMTVVGGPMVQWQQISSPHVVLNFQTYQRLTLAFVSRQ